MDFETMSYEDWQKKRRDLSEREQKERSINWQQSRPNLQASVNEQAIRELYGKLEALEKAFIQAHQKQTGKG